jgi:hypothetical protein
MIVHDAATAGKINWNQDIFINFIGGNLRYKIVANPSTTHITLADNQVAYINLVREVDIVPELTFTNGSTTVSGLSSWTSGLQAGDFVKLAEGDETTYMEIASVLSLTSVQLTTAYAGTTVTKKAQYAYGSYETNATPSTNRHIWVAARSAVPFDQDTYWIFFRSDNGGSVPHVYVRFTETELEQGESQNINDGIPLELLAYVGSPTESDSTPDYADLAPGAKTGTENYNGLNGQNLTERLSYVTSMVADKAQDKTLKYAETYNSIINTTNGTAQELTFIGIGTPTLDIILPSSTNFKNTITLTGTLSLEQNEVAYFTINRNAGFSVANLAALTITTLDLLPLEENVYVFAYRLTDEFCYLYNNRKLKLGGNPVNSGSGVIKVTLHDPVSTTLPLGAVTVDGQSVVNDDRVLFTNLTSGADRIYTALVTAGNVTSWRTEYDFAGFQDPEDGDFVIVQDGTLFADQLGKFNGTEWVFNDKVRYFNGTDFFEQSSLLTSSIANNQSVAADLTTYAFAGSEYSIMEYSISRGSSRETGLAMISTDGVTVAFNQSSATLSATGVTLSADISGANIRIRYTSDNSGSTGTFKFNIRRWSNSAGGPSGVPSYSGGGGGGSVTSSGTPANGEIAFFTTTTDITSNSLLKYSTANQAISLNNLEISTLSTGSILDNQSSPVAVLSYNATSYPFAIIEYSVERGANRRVGRFMVTHDGVTPELGEDFIQKGDTGTTFTADISGGNVRILYTSTNTGTSGTLKFSMRRWA